MPELVEAILRRSRQAGPELTVLPLEATTALAADHGLSLRQVEVAACRAGCWPARYQRNAGAYTLQDQARLLEGRVALVGLGGLGGVVLDCLARLGVGTIHGADGDVFEASNLNRQLLATSATLGSPKVTAARNRTHDVNPSVDLGLRQDVLDATAMARLVTGSQVAIDALGGLEYRLALQRAAATAGIPLVTGAVAGPTGFVAVVLPGQSGPADLLGQQAGVETRLGNQAPVVWTVASLMAHEVARLLTTGASPLSGAMLLLDLHTQSYERVTL